MNIFPLNRFLKIITVGILFMSCNTSKKTSWDAENKWYGEYTWLNGLSLKPHASIDQKEFSRQYHANNKWWDEAFDFLKTHDLEALKPGTYPIDGDNVVAIVSEVSPKEKDKVNFEAHKDFNDLQYIIKGKVNMGVSPYANANAKVTIPYSKEKDTETFSIEKGAAYYTAEPGTFFIFSPKDIHRPAFKFDNYDNIKKIVIKVRVP